MLCSKLQNYEMSILNQCNKKTLKHDKNLRIPATEQQLKHKCISDSKLTEKPILLNLKSCEYLVVFKHYNS